ncbi:hypothetical protein J6590_061709 [Homalodisca vitripennis]|nr:hypothetical protein J6590_061709 [Homalodisca vitripennis]
MASCGRRQIFKSPIPCKTKSSLRCKGRANNTPILAIAATARPRSDSRITALQFLTSNALFGTNPYKWNL